MIRLSTKGRYGTRLLLNLAARYGDGTQSVILKSISEEEEISIRYLEQIIIPLKLNKIVRSIRGAGGGYALSRPPDQIKLSEVLRILEGTCCLVECIEDENYCGRRPSCATFDVWKGATELLKNYFGNITLQDLVEIQGKKKKKGRDKAKPKIH
jgi:Rrf2 family protein